MRHLLVITTLLAASTLAHADVWRWVDATGRVHYSDLPVEGAVKVATSNPRVPSPTASTQPRQSTERAQLATSTARIDQQQADKTAAQAVREDLDGAREKQCTDARERYEKSIQARRIFRTSEDGEKQYLPDADADALRVEYRQDMEAACGRN